MTHSLPSINTGFVNPGSETYPINNSTAHFASIVLNDTVNTNPIPLNLKDRAIKKLSEFKDSLDISISNNPVQEQIDSIARQMEKKFAPLKQFNDWINSNGEGDWYKKVATFLAKLPLKVARNIVKLLYDVVKSLLHAAVHPLNALLEASQFLVNLIDQLSKPETWTKIGASVTGAAVGQGLVSGNPLSILAIGIGGAMITGGLSGGALKAAFNAPNGGQLKAALKNFLSQLKDFPETALTGFSLGLISGSIQKIYSDNFRISSPEDAQKFIDHTLREHGLDSFHNTVFEKLNLDPNLLKYSSISVDPSGRIVVLWDNALGTHQFVRFNPSFFNTPDNIYKMPWEVQMTLSPNATTFKFELSMNTWSDNHLLATDVAPASSFGLNIQYPKAPLTFNHVGLAASGAASTQ